MRVPKIKKHEQGKSEQFQFYATKVIAPSHLRPILVNAMDRSNLLIKRSIRRF